MRAEPVDPDTVLLPEEASALAAGTREAARQLGLGRGEHRKYECPGCSRMVASLGEDGWCSTCGGAR